MFLFKKITAALLAPLPLCLLAILLGLLLLWFTQKKKTGNTLIFLGITLLTLLSLTPVSNSLLASLENRYPGHLQQSTTNNNPVKFIVVLGGGHITDPAISITSQASTSTLVRVTEGVRLLKAYPGSQLVLSGGSVFSSYPEAETMHTIAKVMGVTENNLILERQSKDTKDQAVNIKKIVEDNHFILITSASHMHRAMALFENQGLSPTPAPTNHRARKINTPSPGYYFPNAAALRSSEIFIHEHLGMLWARLRGQI
ncbi:MAG: envelope biogenesis factor ElyC [Gammaproteobacteria bacterium]|nr:envelope biogenesis factor ElyC [Gammaproteobacteria bacterium]